jgi:N-methylhydantoinase B/oxoprolinase/acetone carboxylase alpha subunit
MYKAHPVVATIRRYTKDLKLSTGSTPVGPLLDVNELTNEAHLNFSGTNRIIYQPWNTEMVKLILRHSTNKTSFLQPSDLINQTSWRK